MEINQNLIEFKKQEILFLMNNQKEEKKLQKKREVNRMKDFLEKNDNITI